MMLNLQKIVIVPDKFKGSLTSLEVANSIQWGLIKGNQNLSIVFSIIHVADGGDGIMYVIEQCLDNNHIRDTFCISKLHHHLVTLMYPTIVMYTKITFIYLS